MGGKKNSKEDVNASSADSVHSSEDDDAPEYVVERIVDKKMVKGQVSEIVFVVNVLFFIIGNI